MGNEAIPMGAVLPGEVSVVSVNKVNILWPTAQHQCLFLATRLDLASCSAFILVILVKIGGFTCVQSAISSAVMDVSCKLSISKTVSAGVVDVAGKPGNGNPLSSSALACEIVFHDSIVYSYDDSVRTHLWIQFVACCWDRFVFSFFFLFQEWLVISLQDESMTTEKCTKLGYSNYTHQGLLFNLPFRVTQCSPHWFRCSTD